MNNLLLRRRMLMQAGGSPTPPTMVDVEYLISNGAYIDTGITPDSNYTIECEFMFLGTIGSNSHNVFGCGQSYVARNYELYNANGANMTKFEVHYAGYRNIGTVTTNEMYKIVQNKGDIVIYNADSTVNDTYNFGTKTFTCPYTMILFGTHRAALYLSPQPTAIKTFKMIDGSNNIVCNYKSVRLGTVGYMYDSVTDSLKGSDNANSFLYGPDFL